MYKQAFFRFYAELNDFLLPCQKYQLFPFHFRGTPSVKDAIEARQVPHTEVDLVLIDGCSVNFRYLLKGGEYIAVYPVFERLDIQPLQHLRAKPLRVTRFIADVHLGKLAGYLRLLGFDTLYQNNYPDDVIIDISVKEKRVILTRDLGILKHGRVSHGYWVRSVQPTIQLSEVIRALQIESQVNPFSRCSVCNGVIMRVPVDRVTEYLPGHVRYEYDQFFQCEGCQRVYWKGSHYQRILSMIVSAGLTC